MPKNSPSGVINTLYFPSLENISSSFFNKTSIILIFIRHHILFYYILCVIFDVGWKIERILIGKNKMFFFYDVCMHENFAIVCNFSIMHHFSCVRHAIFYPHTIECTPSIQGLFLRRFCFLFHPNRVLYQTKKKKRKNFTTMTLELLFISSSEEKKRIEQTMTPVYKVFL